MNWIGVCAHSRHTARQLSSLYQYGTISTAGIGAHQAIVSADPRTGDHCPVKLPLQTLVQKWRMTSPPSACLLRYNNCNQERGGMRINVVAQRSTLSKHQVILLSYTYSTETTEVRNADNRESHNFKVHRDEEQRRGVTFRWHQYHSSGSYLKKGNAPRSSIAFGSVDPAVLILLASSLPLSDRIRIMVLAYMRARVPLRPQKRVTGKTVIMPLCARDPTPHQTMGSTQVPQRGRGQVRCYNTYQMI
ncbi:hypothetical protein EDC04DRAFT_3088770 [Pisolithus marmoratus]|nr:hypothetical protein EDC04DRAFT_3088770 [Pisolithus marmoratus]